MSDNTTLSFSWIPLFGRFGFSLSRSKQICTTSGVIEPLLLNQWSLNSPTSLSKRMHLPRKPLEKQVQPPAGSTLPCNDCNCRIHYECSNTNHLRMTAKGQKPYNATWAHCQDEMEPFKEQEDNVWKLKQGNLANVSAHYRKTCCKGGLYPHQKLQESTPY